MALFDSFEILSSREWRALTEAFCESTFDWLALTDWSVVDKVFERESASESATWLDDALCESINDCDLLCEATFDWLAWVEASKSEFDSASYFEVDADSESAFEFDALSEAIDALSLFERAS